jgi:hypothetical protein
VSEDGISEATSYNLQKNAAAQQRVETYKRNKNTPLITICDALGKTEEEIDNALSSIRDDTLYTAGGNSSLRRLQLSFLGYLLTETRFSGAVCLLSAVA